MLERTGSNVVQLPYAIMDSRETTGRRERERPKITWDVWHRWTRWPFITWPL